MLCKVNGFGNPDSVTVYDKPQAGNSLWNATPGHLSRGIQPQKETVGKGGKVRLPTRRDILLRDATVALRASRTLTEMTK
jgi:hypothetical protein